MSAKDLKAFIRHLITEMNKGKATAMALIDKNCATSIVWHDPSGQDIRGLKDFKKYMGEMYDAFPDIHWTIDDMVVEGEKAAIRYTVTATHKGAFMGVPPTNKKFKDWGIAIDRYVGKKCVESWSRSDTLGVMQQLGVIPTPKK